MTFRYVPPAATVGEVEEWCREHGYTVDVDKLHVGPDGLYRGACIVPEVPGAIPAASLDVS